MCLRSGNGADRGQDVTESGGLLLIVLLILEVKHFICDYPLQTGYMLKNKGTYGHPGGIIHSAIHMIGTTLAFLVITPPLAYGLAIMAGEFVIHYHIDWTKEQFMRRMKLTQSDNAFWYALGADQLAHHLTYVGIAAVLWWSTFAQAAP
jgi:hypothetical protein